ncbi:unnamed protein product [Medioppia subpectinata]|uniref:Testican-3 n=1 Tax=Medioppia subpectinata TaxID=1979941 RepID=A0A7R9L4M8_9ACAR|nr:unnamed protein product [Medioppia subpectinata]CAG2114345.1 unnamed protein product [Medioppia subpectinata]
MNCGIKCLSFALLVALIASVVQTKHRTADDDTHQRVQRLHHTTDDKDFDFGDDKQLTSKSSLNREMRQMYNWWTIEDICKDVKCKSWEYCVIKSKGVAVCVHKKQTDAKDVDVFDVKPKSKSKQAIDLSIDDNEDEDDEEYDDESDEKNTFTKSDENKLKLCTPCPVVRPEFICGSDNATYSSICRLDFHNCVHKTDVRLECTGFCPCLQKKNKKTKIEKKWSESRKTGKDFENKNKLREEKKSYSDLKSNDNNMDNKFKSKSKSYFKPNNKYKKPENKQNMQNSVLPNRHYESSKAEHKKCTADDLKSMGSRLVDWFSVVIAEQKKDHAIQSRKHSAFKIPDCQPEVSYMFHHFDTNSDLKLSLKELYYLEHDQNEHCLQPYLTQCDEDNDKFLSAYEWCTCFDKKSQPCLNALKHTKKGLLGAYSPQCDSHGFYKPMQCHSSSGICWCVDKNGVEFTNTRRRGSPDCKGLLNRARHRTIEDQLISREDIDVDDDGDDDDDTDGSGDDRISV